MDANATELIGHPGDLPLVDELSATADTFGGRVPVEWNLAAPVTPLGQLPFAVYREGEREQRHDLVLREAASRLGVRSMMVMRLIRDETQPGRQICWGAAYR
jgi:hypothetical protein